VRSPINNCYGPITISYEGQKPLDLHQLRTVRRQNVYFVESGHLIRRKPAALRSEATKELSNAPKSPFLLPWCQSRSTRSHTSRLTGAHRIRVLAKPVGKYTDGNARTKLSSSRTFPRGPLAPSPAVSRRPTLRRRTLDRRWEATSVGARGHS